MRQGISHSSRPLLASTTRTLTLQRRKKSLRGRQAMLQEVLRQKTEQVPVMPLLTVSMLSHPEPEDTVLPLNRDGSPARQLRVTASRGASRGASRARSRGGQQSRGRSRGKSRGRSRGQSRGRSRGKSRGSSGRAVSAGGPLGGYPSAASLTSAAAASSQPQRLSSSASMSRRHLSRGESLRQMLTEASAASSHGTLPRIWR